MSLLLTSIRIVFLVFLTVSTASLEALSYPTVTPSGETTGGTYRLYFDNIFSSETVCDASNLFVTGFDSIGTPICKAPVSTGLFLTGQTLGDTIRFDGTNWLRNNLIYNDGSAIGIANQSPSFLFDVGGTANFLGLSMPTGAASGMVLTSDASGLAHWSSYPSISLSGIIGGVENVVPKFGIGGSGLTLSLLFDDGNAVGINTIAPTAGYMFDVTGGDAIINGIRVGVGGGNLSSNVAIGLNAFSTNVTSPNNVIIGNLAGSTLVAGAGGNILIGNGVNTSTSTSSNELNIGNWIYGNAGKIGIGVSNTGTALLEVAGQIKITGGSPAAGLYLQSDATGLGTWTGVTAVSLAATGITGGTEFYLTKFGTSGNGIYASTLYESGGRIGLGNVNPSVEFDINGGIRIRSGASLGYILQSDANGVASWQPASASSNAWLLTGNAGTTAGTNFIGTTDSQDLVMKTNSGERMRILAGGNIGIGTAVPGQKLTVSGGTIQIINGSEGNGKILVSDASGIATWQNTTATLSGTYWSLSGNTVGANDFIGTTNNADLILKRNSIQVGRFMSNGNIALGQAALTSNTTGYSNVAIASGALTSNTAGTGNIAIGNESLRSITTSQYQTAIGYQAMRYSIGLNGITPNIAIGYQALYGGSGTAAANTGSDNVGMGYQALFGTPNTPTTGYQNVALGNGAMMDVTSGYSNTAVGFQSLLNTTTGCGNSALGYQSLYSNIGGCNNIAIGYRSLYTNSNGTYNTALGISALHTNNGSYNVATGYRALYANSAGTNNTANGSFALYNTTGNNNLAIGYLAGSGITSGSNNIAIGYDAQVATSTASNQLNLGNLIYGTGMTGSGAGNIGIGTSIPTAKLEVAGQVKITGGTPGVGKVLTSDATGLASWVTGFSGTTTASGITGGSGFYIAYFGTGGNGIFPTSLYFTGGKIGMNTISPTYSFDVQGNSGIIRASSGFCLGMTLSGCLTDWSDLDNIVKSHGTPHYIAKFDSDGAINNSQLYETGGQLWIGDIPGIVGGGATKAYITIESAGSTNSSNPFLTLSEMGGQECRLWITGANKLGSNCAWTAGMGGSYQPNQIIRADSVGSDLTGSVIYQNGSNIGIGITNATSTLTVSGTALVSGNLTVLGKLITDTIVNRSVNNVSISGSILPDVVAPLAYRDIGSNGTRWNNLYLSGQITIGGGSPGLNKILTSSPTGLATWSSVFSGTTIATAVTGGSGFYIPYFGTGGTGLYTSAFYQSGSNIGLSKINPSYKFDVNGTGAFLGIRLTQGAGSGLYLMSDTTGNATWTSNVVATSLNIPSSVLGSTLFNNGTSWVAGTNLYNTGGNIGIGSTTPGQKLTVSGGTIQIVNGTQAAGRILTSDANGVASWTGIITATSLSIPGSVTGATLYYTGGNWLAGTGLYNAGGNIGIGTITPGAKLTITSGLTGTSGLRFSNLTSTSSVVSTNVVGLGVNALGDVVPVSNGDVIVYDGLSTSTPSPNPDNANRTISYDFNKYFDIPARQSFVVSDGSGPGQNAPYIDEDASSSVCEWTGTYGTGMATCPTSDSPGSPYNSFTMSARGLGGIGYQLGIAYRGDVPLMARSGYFRGGYGSGLYLGTTSNVPAPWFKVFTVPTNHIEYFYIDTGFTGRFANTGRAGNVAVGTTTPDSKFEVWNTLGSTSLLHFRGTNNVGIGSGAVRTGLTGNANSGFGHESLFTLTSGYSNTAIGYKSMRLTAGGFNNTALGQESLYNNNGGSWNTALGYQSVYNNSSGTGNIGIGPLAVYYNSVGANNIGIGYYALRGITGNSTSNNVAIGLQSLSGTTGNNNIALGAYAGDGLRTGSNNIIIGYNGDVPSPTGSDQLSIGNWIYGSGGNIGIGTSTGTAKLEIAGQIKITGGSPGAGKVLTSDANGLATWQTPSGTGGSGGGGATGSGWSLSGNTIGANDFIGSINNDSLRFYTNNTQKMILDTSGNLGIGTSTGTAKLTVAGTIKLGVNGTVTTAMGICTTGNITISNTASNQTCTGLPASTSIALSCTPNGAFSTPNTTALNCRPTGTINQMACNTTQSNSNARTYKCMWMQ